ncbi:AraC family transcriptional regulator [Candidatus Nomurabacteria bacterium]|nr:AraC family transcriptional regulator [Candidatus Nomurabacteria bacterium]
MTVNDLSALLHFHPNYVISFFKEAIGIPPIEYINSLRIEMSKKLLEADEMQIKQVAASVGFKTSYYFSRIFRQKTGLSPSEYRLISQANPRLLNSN